jgi:phosphoribosylformimino-5-aminoimidazole carboxamide ribonucleotide (ProFAR) isomerase
VIASGGVSTLDEAEELLEEGVYQVVVGKALYERPEMYAR